MPDPEDGAPCHLCTARCCKDFALPIERPDPEDGAPCHLCTARCCKDFALPIERPTKIARPGSPTPNTIRQSAKKGARSDAKSG